jgi:acyl carrier protein phosphodiesterase
MTGMNFLAHLLLSDPAPASRLGSVLPDLMRVRPADPLPDLVIRAVVQHRRIDKATDLHPAFIDCRSKLTPDLGRFAGVCLDVFMDHALSRRWADYSTQPRRMFIDEVYAQIVSLGPNAPEPVRPALARMVEHDWLGAYETVQGVRLTFARMSVRLSERFGRPIDMTPMADALDAHWDLIDTTFVRVFEDVRLAERKIAYDAGIW